MAARAMWKGTLRFADVRLPVKLYSAVQDRSLRFRLLAAEKHAPIEQRMVNPQSDEPVPYADVKRGFLLDDGGFVLLGKDDLRRVAPEPSREIEIVRFVDPKAVSHEWFVRPYYLGPDGASERYFAVREALESEGVEGIARWVMRSTEYGGVLRAQGDYLMLFTLRHADEVVPASALPKPEGRAHNEKEARIAEQLIESFVDRFDPSVYKDEYRERVLSYVEQKAGGKRVRLQKPLRKVAEPNLADALARSLAQVRKEPRRGAHKAS